MAYRYIQCAAVLAALLQCTAAQKEKPIPDDMTSGFRTGEEIQVSFDDNAVSGFKSGTVFEKDEVDKEPTFALGDSNGISPTTLHTLIMVDTTCEGARKLHYARSNFKFDFQGGTNIASKTDALQTYQAPGAFGEKGDDRQYTFLMYINPNRKEITELKMPGEGEDFDLKKFEEDNGLRPPTAGVGMVVKLGGEAECEGGTVAPAPAEPGAEESKSAAATSGAETGSATSIAETTAVGTSTAVTSEAAASSSAETSAPATSAPGGSVTTIPAAATSAASAPATSAPVSSVPADSVAPTSAATPTAGNSSQTASGAAGSPRSTITVLPSPNDDAAAGATSAAGSNGNAVSTAPATSVALEGSNEGTGVAGSAPAQATENAAAGQYAAGMAALPFVAMIGAFIL